MPDSFSDSRVFDALALLMSENRYLYFAGRHVSKIGISVDGEHFALQIDGTTGDVSLDVLNDNRVLEPDFWVDLNAGAIFELAAGKSATSPIVLRTGPKGQTVHPRIEEVIHRCFQPPPYPLDDREWLIYPSLFGFSDPREVWQSAQSMVRVLQFAGAQGDYCASSGLTEPWARKPASIYDKTVAGAGYEVVIRTDAEPVVREFAAWLKYIDDQDVDILPGEWLEFEEGRTIAGTNIAGFLVTRPREFQTTFPVGSSIAHWHYLVPVSGAELELAKTADFDAVVDDVQSKQQR